MSQTKQMKVLIVDDDSHIRDVINFALEQEGYKTAEASDGKEALQRFAQFQPDLMVLDVMMPEMDGFEVCREIRKSSDIPVLFLSAKNEEIDRIIGLEIGGDDYISKPFSPRELIARIRAITRRLSKNGSTNGEVPQDSVDVLTCGGLILNKTSYTVSWENIEISLTATEFGLLKTLMQHPEKVFSRDDLMNSVYSYDVVVSYRTIDSHIRGVRTKLAESGCEDVVVTVHGIGYKLGGCK